MNFIRLRGMLRVLISGAHAWLTLHIKATLHAHIIITATHILITGKCQIISLGSKLLENKSGALQLIIQIIGRLYQTMSVFLILRLINLFLIPVLPDMQKVKSEQFQLTLNQFVLFLEERDFLLQLLDIGYLHPLQMKFEDLYT